VGGSRTHLQALSLLHGAIQPKLYLEIGVHRGASLRLATCRAVAVDPDPRVVATGPNVALFRTTSDDFFRYDAANALQHGIDLAFIDGMHLFEFALRDFMNLERYAAPGAVVVIDDVLPNHELQALRMRDSIAWTGDVWKLHDCLRTYRPDLSMVLLDTSPAGLLVVAGLDRANSVLWDCYNTITDRYLAPPFSRAPASVLRRVGSVALDSPELAQLLAARHSYGIR